MDNFILFINKNMKNKLIDENGNIILSNKNGVATRVGTIKNGITYNVFRSKARRICKVTIMCGAQHDEFFFHEDGNPAFHHIMNRDLSPNLMVLYLKYFANEDRYSPEDFIEYMFLNYFTELGYSRLDGELK